jgi:acyl-CoA reductase-like NAD-dependent aldehyde dehydrogenase
MAVLREETFGPLLPIQRVKDAEQALALANSTPHGLSGSVWSRDVARARDLARRLETGSVSVNDSMVHYFCVEAPLGGWKGSGLGFRHGVECLLQFTRPQTLIEDRPGLGWLGPRISAALGFPYRERVARVLRWLMRRY